MDCIDKNASPMTDYTFGKKVVVILEAIRKSMARNGKTQEIKQ